MASPVLMAVVCADDRECLKNALRGSHWTLESMDTLEEALRQSRYRAIGVAICAPVLPDGHSWTDLLDGLHSALHRPPVIVAAPHIDGRLWAEVINLGGSDVVVKPFDRDEVLHVLRSARLRSRRSLNGGASNESGRGRTQQLFPECLPADDAVAAAGRRGSDAILQRSGAQR
jgi:DNA-binding NtrC family response regulator